MQLFDRLNGPAVLRLTRPVPVPEKLQAGLRTRQVNSINNLISIMLVVSLLNMAVVLIELRVDSLHSISAAWGFGLVLLTAVSFVQHRRWLKFKNAEHLTDRKIAAIVRSARIHGLFWGALPLLVSMEVYDPQLKLIFIVTAGMMFGGTFLLSRVPDAAIAYLLPIGVGLVLSAFLLGTFSSHLIGFISIIYVFVLMYAIAWANRQFIQQFLAEAAISEQSQLISLLLRDFGESSSDWLWQTDADYRIESVPCSQPGTDAATTFMSVGRNLFSMFQNSDSRRHLEQMMREGKPFRDIKLRVKVSGWDDCWVSLTGKPICEKNGALGFRGIASNITLAKQAEKRIERMAHFDELTGLPNRANLLSQLESLRGQTVAAGQQRAFVCLDLDSFKLVNDTLGHRVADQLLRQVTNRLTERSLASDFVARISSDGFALIIERPTDGGIEKFLEALSNYLAQPYSVGGATVACTASIGARIDADGLDALTLLKHADLAMYHARRQRNGEWAIFSPALQDKADARLRRESDLRSAIELGQLSLVYQPQLCVETHRITGFEALVRWNHPTLGTIPPSEFIPIAEETGLIVKIGEWIIRTAMAEAARLPGTMRMAINISPLQMNSKNLVSIIVNALATNRLDPARIELEITESVLMADTGFALNRLHQLRDLGLRISLDDFGTGYSSLSYLRMFPFNKIKIDQSFIRDLETNTESRAIAQATITLAQLMGLRCTAEGVETLYQAEFLRELGCNELQGYLIGKGRPIADQVHLIEGAYYGRSAAEPAQAGEPACNAPTPIRKNVAVSVPETPVPTLPVAQSRYG